MKIQNVKGGYDFLPKEQQIRNEINRIIRETFELYGYSPIETPILCYYDMLIDKYGEENDIVKEIYKVTDQASRELGLRYDLTVPFAKFIALNKNKIRFPFKRYEIAKVFRDGPIKMGRDREFTQCDADVVGLAGQMIEAELMTLFVDAFQKMNIEIMIQYNSRKLMTGLILECAISEEKVSLVTTIIDKIQKMSEDEFKNNLFALGLQEEQILFLKECFHLSLDELTRKFKETKNEKIKIGLYELNELTKYLEQLGIASICVFTPSLARGQNYYTGNVFEVYERNRKVTGSIGAGGRYDNMITDFINDGTSYPALGISFGLSSIYELVKTNGLMQEKINVSIYIIPLDTKIESLQIANRLRKLGYKVEVEMQNQKLKKSLTYADKEKIPYVIVLGEEEIRTQKITLKRMSDGSMMEVGLNALEKMDEWIKSGK